MQKIKKLSALLLAVVLMLVVMTGCGGGGGYGPVDGRTVFVNRVNQARRESSRSTLARNTDLDKVAKDGMELYTAYLDGTISSTDVMTARSEFLKISTSYARYTFLDWYTVDSNEDYYSGNYKFKLDDNIRTVSGDIIGVYATSYKGKMRICAIIVDMY